MYDHGRKAGNRGDVWKHAVLVSVADRIPVTAKVRYVDSHAGAPLHELAERGEWRAGVNAVLAAANPPRHPYIELARTYLRGNHYPAGWVFVASRFAARCEQVEMILSDQASAVASKYTASYDVALPSNVDVRFEQADGYSSALAHATADLLFLDPPFTPSADADWKALAKVCGQLSQQGRQFLVWYPIYWPTKPQRFVDTVRCSAWEATWATFGPKPSQNLKGCGVLASLGLSEIVKAAESELVGVCDALGAKLTVRIPSHPSHVTSNL